MVKCTTEEEKNKTRGRARKEFQEVLCISPFHHRRRHQDRRRDRKCDREAAMSTLCDCTLLLPPLYYCPRSHSLLLLLLLLPLNDVYPFGRARPIPESCRVPHSWRSLRWAVLAMNQNRLNGTFIIIIFISDWDARGADLPVTQSPRRS